MKRYFVIFVNLLFLSVLNMQKVHYATRFRSMDMETETDSAYITYKTIFQYEKEHRLSADVNVTKDINVKTVHVILHRCAFEKAACEYFQSWKISHNLKGFVFMKNQLWTPLFSSIVPRLSLPILKKNLYIARNSTVNAEAAVLFYPDVVKYYWKADIAALDINDKRGMAIQLELEFFEYVERNRKRKQ